MSKYVLLAVSKNQAKIRSEDSSLGGGQLFIFL